MPYYMDQDKDERRKRVYIETPWNSDDNAAIEEDIDINELDTEYRPTRQEYRASARSPSSSNSSSDEIQILPSQFLIFFVF